MSASLTDGQLIERFKQSDDSAAINPVAVLTVLAMTILIKTDQPPRVKPQVQPYQIQVVSPTTSSVRPLVFCVKRKSFPKRISPEFGAEPGHFSKPPLLIISIELMHLGMASANNLPELLPPETQTLSQSGISIDLTPINGSRHTKRPQHIVLPIGLNRQSGVPLSSDLRPHVRSATTTDAIAYLDLDSAKPLLLKNREPGGFIANRRKG